MQAVISFTSGKEKFYGLVQPYILNNSMTATSKNSGKTIPKGRLKYVLTKIENGEPTSILGFIANLNPGKHSVYSLDTLDEQTNTLSLKRNKIVINETVYMFP